MCVTQAGQDELSLENIKIVSKDFTEQKFKETPYSYNYESLLNNYERSNESFNFLPSLKKSNSRNNNTLGGEKILTSNLSKASLTRND